MEKYIEIERLGHEENENIFSYPEDMIYITEKVDGGNASFFIDDDNIIHTCSRNRDLTTDKDEKTFQNERKQLYDLLKEKQLNKDFIYYGEWGAKHTITYSNMPPFVGFDIRVKRAMKGDSGNYIGHHAMKTEYDRLGISTVPLLGEIKVKDLMEKKLEDFIGKSMFYEGPMEGIVIKNYARKNVFGRQMFAKIVRDEFKEQNRATFGGIKSDVGNDSYKIFDTYITEARIRKTLNRLINEDNLKLEMAIMQYLPIEVIEDVFKEETRDVLKIAKNINTGTLKKLTSRRCIGIIQEEMKKKILERDSKNDKS